MKALEMIDHNVDIYKRTSQLIPTKGRNYLDSPIKGEVRVINTREDLAADFTDMVGYIVATRPDDKHSLVLLPTCMRGKKLYGMMISFAPDDIVRID